MTVRVLGHDPVVETVLAPGPPDFTASAGFRGSCSCGWTGQVRDHPSPAGNELAAADALEHVAQSVRYRYRGRPYTPFTPSPRPPSPPK